MLDPNRPPKKDERGLGANIAAAVLLTILAIPVLLIGTCVPAVVLSVAFPKPEIVVGGLLAAAILFCGALAYHAEMPGKKIGFGIAALEILVFGFLLYSGRLFH